MAAITCKELDKSFSGREVLKRLSLDVPEGVIVGLLGSSGAGKTTFARILCGLETPDRGSVTFSGPARVMLIPQDFTIWPELTVEANVALGHRGAKAQRNELVSSWLHKLGLHDLNSRYAGELSYGQQQRVAVARAFCFHPAVMVLDEPFAHLDARARSSASKEIADICRGESITTVWITHDAREAFSVAERLAVMDNGVIAQFDAPELVYRRPISRTVALLTGDMNLFEARDWNEFLTICEEPDRHVKVERDQVIGLRPEDIEILPGNSTAAIRFVGCTFLGRGYYHQIRLRSGLITNIFHPTVLLPDGMYRIKINGEPCVFR